MKLHIRKNAFIGDPHNRFVPLEKKDNNNAKVS